MKKQIKKLEAANYELEEKLQAREDYFNDRSEAWQLSEKGDDYEYKTEELQEIIYKLDEVTDELKQF